MESCPSGMENNQFLNNLKKKYLHDHQTTVLVNFCLFKNLNTQKFDHILI